MTMTHKTIENSSAGSKSLNRILIIVSWDKNKSEKAILNINQFRNYINWAADNNIKLFTILFNKREKKIW